MKNVLKSKFLWTAALAACLTIAGCNIFNPTENVNIKNDDPNALTYEGYIKFRDNEYSNAEEYFNRAIAADSSHSEAWLGLMKSILNRKLNTTAETNVFALLKYVNTDRDADDKTVPFADLPDSVAAPLREAIDSVNYIATQFIERDKNGKTDGKVTYKYISDGYMVIQMLKTMLVLKTKMPLQCADKEARVALGDSLCSMQTILNDFKGDPNETVETFHEVFNTCETNPESMTSLFEDYLQGFSNEAGYLTKEAKNQAITGMCSALAQETDIPEDDSTKQARTMNIIIGQLGYSDIIDDDGDGCVDEELYDGEDNDGDGEIDEDISDKTNEIHYDDMVIMSNIAQKKMTIKELRVIKSAGPNGKYRSVDIDMNGKTVEDDPDELDREWSFIYSNYKDRVNNNDHRLVFSKDLPWNMEGGVEGLKERKRLIAQDTNKDNPTYSLEDRKSMVGGCWVNYDEDRFKKWFEGRTK
ncbi:MAG: hypothetical protein SPM09_02310 [Fibrobacter sp.]|jgi:tetratricopeptide (TPR) repeat protein|uniref:tetratricopeptide repeat protein n=1 Tax=Fibrobacter sp. TaxID=35828 RepID=UPI002A919E6A|nr:hypothetical protein [Fibrobacter sp.]MDY6263220.1 hypothetical protein [Fibrobacter sp.]